MVRMGGRAISCYIGWQNKALGWSNIFWRWEEPLWHLPQFWTFYHHNNTLHFAGHVMWVNTWWQRKECSGLSAIKESYGPAMFVFTIFWFVLKLVLKFHGWQYLKFMRNLRQQNSFVYGSLEIWWIDASKLRPVHCQALIWLISLFRKKFQMWAIKKAWPIKDAEPSR